MHENQVPSQAVGGHVPPREIQLAGGHCWCVRC